MSHTYEFPKADITVDCVLFGFSEERDQLEVVLIRRGEEPFQGCWALPGGFIEFGKGETALEAARREMEEETGVRVDYLEQLKTFDDPNRDPRGRTFSVAHFALVRAKDHSTQHGSDAMEARWVSVPEAQAIPDEEIAFDHKHILQYAIERLQNKVRYAPVGLELLPKEFTLGQLQRLYEAILLRKLDRGNFRKRIRKINKDRAIFKEVGSTPSRRGPESTLYRFNKLAYDRAVREGFNFEI